MERFGDEQLVRFRSVSVGGIDQIHTELDRALQHLDRVCAVGWPTPNAFARETHRAETEPVHFEIAADLENRVRRRPRRGWRSQDFSARSNSGDRKSTRRNYSQRC